MGNDSEPLLTGSQVVHQNDPSHSRASPLLWPNSGAHYDHRELRRPASRLSNGHWPGCGAHDAMNAITCTRCNQTKPESEFYYQKYRCAYRSQCRACVALVAKITKAKHRAEYAEANKVWRQRNRATMLKNIKAWRSKNLNRTRLVQVTNTRVRRALARGLLTKPDRCEFCGGGSTDTIEAAHEDYNKPFQIRWLCRPCHRKWDTEQPKTKLCESLISEICMRRTVS